VTGIPDYARLGSAPRVAAGVGRLVARRGGSNESVGPRDDKERLVPWELEGESVFGTACFVTSVSAQDCHYDHYLPHVASH
jgi:hypothetical protein